MTTFLPDYRLAVTGYQPPDRPILAPMPLPLTRDECRAMMTPQIDAMLRGASRLLNRAQAAEPTDFWLAVEIEDAADLLMEQAFAMLCRRYVELDELDWREDAFTRYMNRPDL